MMIVLILVLHLLYQTPLSAIVSTGALALALAGRRVVDQTVYLGMREPRVVKPSRWIMAYVAMFGLGAALLAIYRPWSTSPYAADMTSPKYVMCSAVSCLNWSVFFAYMGWTGNVSSRFVFWSLGLLAALTFSVPFWLV